MTPEKLRVGEISYANVFPILKALKENCDCGDYEFVNSVPSGLNKMLREGSLDVSISSSVEYLKDKNNYGIIPGHSISCDGAVMSILLFSRVPIASLGGHEIFVTHQSETSPILLGVLLKKFYGIDVSLTTEHLPFAKAIDAHSAYLAIGDEALVAGIEKTPAGPNLPDAKYRLEAAGRLASFGHNVFYVYDLGLLWRLHTGLPFVFALWITRRDSMEAKRALMDKFTADLDKAKSLALKDLPRLAGESPLSRELGAKRLISYWKAISYDLGERHIKGLELFGSYAGELGLIT